jgi:hypothetical protein
VCSVLAKEVLIYSIQSVDYFIPIIECHTGKIIHCSSISKAAGKNTSVIIRLHSQQQKEVQVIKLY